jgi:hypothetical protein
LYKTLTNPSSPEAIERLSLEAAMDKAVGFTIEQMLVVDSDEDEEEEELGKFIFSLLCPLTGSPMKFPVRGRNCKHWQVSLIQVDFTMHWWISITHELCSTKCFDLEAYIKNNNFPSGGRWRCASCETFLSLQNLQFCGLTAHLLEEFRSEVTTDRHLVEFSSDRSYRLLEARKPRQNRKAGTRETSQSKRQKTVEEHEVIEIELE